MSHQGVNFNRCNVEVNGDPNRLGERDYQFTDILACFSMGYTFDGMGISTWRDMKLHTGLFTVCKHSSR